MFSPVYLLRSLEMHFGNRRGGAACGNDGYLEKKSEEDLQKTDELQGINSSNNSANIRVQSIFFLHILIVV